jgi:hypothetical protein
MSVPRLRDWQRILAGCVTLWMAVMSADLPTLHACAMHSVGAVPGADARMGGMSGMSGASFTAPNVNGLSLVITVASSAPVRHGFPSGIICDSGRPFRNGRPYSTEIVAPLTVHVVFSWGLPPLPVPVETVVCDINGPARHTAASTPM